MCFSSLPEAIGGLLRAVAVNELLQERQCLCPSGFLRGWCYLQIHNCVCCDSKWPSGSGETSKWRPAHDLCSGCHTCALSKAHFNASRERLTILTGHTILSTRLLTTLLVVGALHDTIVVWSPSCSPSHGGWTNIYLWLFKKVHFAIAQVCRESFQKESGYS